ncbi:Sgf29p KNAG_0I01220 [Huiozyma naganishii CBS 8797]|uniref:SGF29 C-terminal domain-containing protein n=1 Tax=Huiozyma naganishii (strain ATCC MYA-139 / BCRC 22969 / CBS 8797 / KCTC 17520 / NBRC 10181 / NCYC 3082 / Yp74L-3) TaxID=1071383 RepID=J7RQ63_HUIN7|nr:hypothetical protein KNAG_0I01220 [Kazachstania naganishii CBS 8797]CCK71913.1 hypothetical protein KNAG_0I01220 [Kazachstania naganishii CBS 8797]
MENEWNVLVSSLQDLYNANEVTSFGKLQLGPIDAIPAADLQSTLTTVQEHLENVRRGQRLLSTVETKLQGILDSTAHGVNLSAMAQGPPGKQYWCSDFNPTVGIDVGAEVAYKPGKPSVDGEWIQCVVQGVSPDGLKFEIVDPEPDEFGNANKTFKCNWKEIILIPPESQIKDLGEYPRSTKVLARYPETTTFYPAVVVGTNKKHRETCRLRFDGEEEVGKENASRQKPRAALSHGLVGPNTALRQEGKRCHRCL